MALAVWLAATAMISTGSDHHRPLEIAAGISLLAVTFVAGLSPGVRRRLLAPLRGHGEPERVGHPIELVRGAAARSGGGVYLGGLRGEFRFARVERAVLLLGPPRSGKTSGVIIPAVLSHEGPVVSTSTKPDVWRATRGARSGAGRVWVFDPTGSTKPGARDVGEELRWSPVPPSRSWDGALSHRQGDDHEYRRGDDGPLALG